MVEGAGYLYWFAKAAIKRYHKQGGLNINNRVSLSQLWRLEVQVRGIGRAGSSEGREGRICSRTLSLPCG